MIPTLNEILLAVANAYGVSTATVIHWLGIHADELCDELDKQEPTK